MPLPEVSEEGSDLWPVRPTAVTSMFMHPLHCSVATPLCFAPPANSRCTPRSTGQAQRYPDFSFVAWPQSECPAESLGAHTWSEQIAAPVTAGPLQSEKSERREVRSYVDSQ